MINLVRLNISHSQFNIMIILNFVTPTIISH